MQPFRAEQIRGTYATLLLPFRRDESIDFGLLRDDLQRILGAGVDGVYSHGTAGEFFSLSEDEFDRVNELLADECERAGTAFQIGAAFPAPAIALQRIERAAKLAPSAIQVTLPDWWPPSFVECVDYVHRCARVAGGIPLVLYNPPHAKRLLSPEEMNHLLDTVPQLAGFKLGGGDAAWYAAMQPVLQRSSVFVPGHTLATGVANGASGSYSNVACLTPAGAVRWAKLMMTDLRLALEQEKAIQSFMTDKILPFRTNGGASNMALDKLLAFIGGRSQAGLGLRWPYRGVAENDALPLCEIARAQMPFLFEEL